MHIKGPLMNFMDAKEGEYVFNRCVYCKEIFTGYKNKSSCPCCVIKNIDSIDKIFRFCNDK